MFGEAAKQAETDRAIENAWSMPGEPGDIDGTA